MKTVMMPPGAQRLRALHSLIDGDGSCTLIYDLERAAVLDVPEELQFHVAPALETGDLDEDLVAWLNAEDLFTLERFAAGADEAEFDLSGQTAWDGFAGHDGALRSPLEPSSAESLLAALDVTFKQGLGASCVALNLSWAGAYPGDELLSRIVVEASRRAAGARQEVRLELALDACVVTPAIAAFLVGCLPLHVRLHCGTFPVLAPGAALPGEDAVWGTAERGVRLLAEMADRLTVECALAGPARLHDLWIWAQQVGVRHLDASRFAARSRAFGPAGGPGSELRQYRGDLLAVSDEICNALEDGRTPVAYQPLTRTVRRLMRSEPLSAAVSPNGIFDAARRSLGTRDDELMGEGWSGLDETASLEGMDFEAAGAPCAECWARFICDHSLLVAPSTESSDRREPTTERCASWRTEAEVALRLYHRLAQVDALQVRRLFEEEGVLPLDLGARRIGGWQQKVAF